MHVGRTQQLRARKQTCAGHDDVEEAVPVTHEDVEYEHASVSAHLPTHEGQGGAPDGLDRLPREVVAAHRDPVLVDDVGHSPVVGREADEEEHEEEHAEVGGGGHAPEREAEHAHADPNPEAEQDESTNPPGRPELVSLPCDPDHLAMIGRPAPWTSNPPPTWTSGSSRSGPILLLAIGTLVGASAHAQGLPEGDADAFEEESCPAQGGCEPSIPTPLPQVGRAPSPPLRVEVLPGPGLEAPRARRLADAFRLRLSRALGVAVVQPPPDPRQGREDNALRQARMGLQAFEELDLGLAERDLAEAWRALAALERPSKASEARLKAVIFAFAATALYDGRGGEALGRFAALASLDPSFRPVGAPDDVTHRYERVVATLGARRIGELRIGSRPGGAAVWIDGQSRGRTPLSVGVSDGWHAVVVRRPGYRTEVRLMSVDGGRATLWTPMLVATPRPPPVVTVAEAHEAVRAAAAAKRLGAEHLLVVRALPDGGLGGTWVSSRGAPQGRRWTLSSVPSNPLVAAELVLQALDAPIVSAPAPPGPGSGLEWWPWAVAGGAAVVAAIGLTAALATESGRSDKARDRLIILGF